MFYMIIIVILLVIASLFSLLETAIVAVSEYKLSSITPATYSITCAISLKKQIEKVLIFSLIGNSLFNTLVITFSTMLVIQFFGSGHGFIFSLSTLLITFLIIIGSEALPKVIAAKTPLTILNLIAIPLYYLFIISTPLIWLIDKIIYLITKVLMIKEKESTTLDELKAIVNDNRILFHENHRSILLNSLQLEQLTIKEVLIPLQKVIMFNLDQNIDILRKKLKKAYHTRILVYHGTVDNIIGYLHIKDILFLLDNGNYSHVELRQLIHKVHYIPEFLSIISQFAVCQQTHERIFIVINEYGGVLGIACLEDMLEIIFGRFTIDRQQKNNNIVFEKKDCYLVNGSTLLRKFIKISGFDLPDDYDAITINGLLIKQLGTSPPPGVCVKFGNIIFEVIQVEKFWAEKVRIYKIEQEMLYSISI